MSAKLIAKLAGSAVLAIGIAVAIQTGASAAPAASATSATSVAPAAVSVVVTPTSGLSDGSVVQMTATGLTPGGSYFAGECAQTSTGVFPCAHPQQNLTADANGDISTTVTVTKTFDGILPDGSDFGLVDCATSTCVVGLGDASGLGGGSIITFN